MLAVATSDGRVRLIDEATGVVRWEVQGAQDGKMRVVQMSPKDGRFVAIVGSDDEYWKLWDAANGVECMAGARHDGKGACTCKVNRSGFRKSLDEGCPVLAHTAVLQALVFSPCGKWLATRGEDETVILWDARTGKAEHRMEVEGDFWSVTFSSDGARLACVGYDASIRVWDVATGALLRTITDAQTEFVFCVQFSPTDSRILASTADEGDLVTLWDVDTGAKVRSLQGSWLVVFSPDGWSIATIDPSDVYTVLLVDAESGECLFRLIGHAGAVYSLIFSKDESKLVSGSFDGTCKVWDSSTGALLRTIELGRQVWNVEWGRDWVRDTQRGVAFAMGLLPRLGAESWVLELEAGVVRMILDRS